MGNDPDLTACAARPGSPRLLQLRASYSARRHDQPTSAAAPIQASSADGSQGASAHLVVRLWDPLVPGKGMELSERNIKPGAVQGEAASAPALGDPGEGAEML
jgi:hypothetical protein